MPIKHLRAALRRYRPYFIVRVTGALTLCLTLALVLIMVTRAVYPAYGCITLTKHIQRSQDSSDDWLTDSSLYDPSSGRYFNSQLSKPAEYRDSFQRSLNDSYIAYTEYLTATDTTNLVVAKTDIGASVVLRQSIDDRDTPATHRLFLWSPGSRWIGYQVQTDSTHIQYKLAEVIPPYRIETIPQLLSVNGRFLGWSADEQYVAISDWDGITQTVSIFAMTDLHTVMTSSQPQHLSPTEYASYGYDGNVAWSPQGHTLAYAAYDGSISHVVLMLPDSKTERVKLLSGAQFSRLGSAFWAPKGGYIAVLSSSSEVFNDYHLDIFGVDDTVWADIAQHVGTAYCADTCFFHLYWFADEGSLAYVDIQRDPTYRSDLITFWLKDRHYETSVPSLFLDPQMLNNGRWLWASPTSLPTTEGTTNGTLYSLDTHQKITFPTYNWPARMSESPDGEIAVVSNNPSPDVKAGMQPSGEGFVWTRLADGILHTVEPNAQKVLFLNWSADSQWFTYLVAPDGDQGVTYLGLANVKTDTNQRIAVKFLRALYWGDSYQGAIPSLDGKFIVLTVSGGKNIQIITTASGRSAQVNDAPENQMNISWSPDSSQFAFTNFKADNDYWLMVYKTDGTLLNTRHLLTDNDSMRWTSCNVNG